MDEAIQDYVAGLTEHRELFERLHRLMLEHQPEVSMSYAMPTYRAGGRRMHLAVWKHGVSVYGWDRTKDGGFLQRHPDLLGSRSTIKLTPRALSTIDDDELRGLLGLPVDVQGRAGRLPL